MALSRRTFLYGATAAAGAGLSASALGSNPSARSLRAESGLVTGKMKPLPYKAVDGFLSADQIRWHHDSHYGGALKKFVTLENDVTKEKKTRVAKANSVVVHELYFDNMTGKKLDPTADVNTTLKARFGSVDKWIEDFQAGALSCKGWAVLAHHPVNGKLYNIASDPHDEGPLWFGVPLVVMDMYEHAYYIDYQNKKAEYVKGFTEHIAWAEIEGRLRAVSK